MKRMPTVVVYLLVALAALVGAVAQPDEALQLDARMAVLTNEWIGSFDSGGR